MSNKPIKILHFAPGFLYGGIESLILTWYKNLDTSVYQLELLLRTQDDDARALVEYRKQGGVYHRLKKMTPLTMLSYARSVKLFFKHHHDYDILHAHGVDPFVFHYAKKYGISKIILHSHAGNARTEKYALVKSIMHSIAMKYPNHKLACSTIAGEYLFGKDSVNNGEVEVLLNAIDAENFKFNSNKRAEYRNQFDWNNKTIIGHIGRMTYPKNYPFILDLFADYLRQNANAHLVLVGDGPERALIEERIKDSGIQDKVELLGLRYDVESLMMAFDALLLPSHWEGLPITIIEAQTTGLPCFISHVITDEVIVTDLVKKLPLTASVQQWSNAISSQMQAQMQPREIYHTIIASSALSTKAHLAKLEKIYQSI